MLHELLRLYAIRAREFSDAVAHLGRHDHVGSEFWSLVKEIKKRQQSCISTGEELDRFIEQGRATAAASDRTPAEMDREIDDAKQETGVARERYKRADEEYRVMTAQALDIGLDNPDGAMAMQVATRNLKSAIEQYQSAVGKLNGLLSLRLRF